MLDWSKIRQICTKFNNILMLLMQVCDSHFFVY